MLWHLKIRRVGRNVVLCSLAIVIGLTTGLLLVGVRLAAPSARVVGAIPADLSRGETVQFASTSGALLKGWWIPADRPGGGTVILLHGLQSNRLQMVERARRLSTAHFSVLLFDFQAHGESSGSHVTMGKLEGLDVASAVRLARSLAPSERIGIIGFSLGAAAILLSPTPLGLDAIVLESPYSDIDHATHNWTKMQGNLMSAPVLEPLIEMLFKNLVLPAFQLSPAELRPIDRISQLDAPILIVWGSKDALVTPDDVKEVFDRASEPKTELQIVGAGHVDFEQFSPKTYWATILPFLTRRLRCELDCDAPTMSASLMPQFIDIGPPAIGDVSSAD